MVLPHWAPSLRSSALLGFHISDATLCPGALVYVVHEKHDKFRPNKLFIYIFYYFTYKITNVKCTCDNDHDDVVMSALCSGTRHRFGKPLAVDPPIGADSRRLQQLVH